MDLQIESLLRYYKRSSSVHCEDDAEGDDYVTYGDYWEFEDPQAVEYWSLHMIGMTHDMCFVVKYKNNDAYLPMTYTEKVKDVTEEDEAAINIHCVTTQVDKPPNKQYHFTICLNSILIPFNISHLLESLEPTEYRSMIKELEEKVDAGFYNNANGTALTGKKLCSKMRLLFLGFHEMKVKLDIRRDMMRPTSLSKDLESPGGSQGSMGTYTPVSQQSRGKRKNATPSQTRRPTRASPLASSSRQLVVPEMPGRSGLNDMSTASALTEIPMSLEVTRKPDYKLATVAYKNFWSSCTDAFLFGVDTKFNLPIDQLVNAPADLNIRVSEENIVEGMMHYLLHLPDRSTRQTLCVMPKGQNYKPGNWETIANGEFYIINGQHSVAASKLMQNIGLDDDMVKEFRTWNCYVVWTKDKEILRTISAYYNRVNHFSIFKPSWATNILGARQVWNALGSPSPPKEATEVGRHVQAKRNKETHVNNEKFKVMYLSLDLA